MAKGKGRIRQSNPVILRPGASIGHVAAEADDEFLFKCFLDHPALETLTDVESAKLFISGRTGAGKTALLRMIQKNNSNSIEINLTELALNYVANSDIVRFLHSIEVDLDLFFQALWRHVFCIEYIRLQYDVNNEESSKSLFNALSTFFNNDQRKKSGIKYLRQWEGKFWITMDENIKEITQRMESEVNTELGAEVQKFSGSAGYSRSLSKEKKSSIVARAKKIVNADLLADLSKVMDMLSTFKPDNKYEKSYYIMVDRIDEKWVDDSIRFQLIRALIECLRAFRKISNLKIIVSMRSDVLEKVVQESNHAGFQREKYDDYFLRLLWSRDQLFELINKRINYLYRRKYTTDNIFFYDIFDRKVGNKDSFDYLIERTLLRPRDIISFVNVCLGKAEGRSRISQNTIRRAEVEYSRIRLQALIEEWESAFPSIRLVFDSIIRRGRTFTRKDFFDSDFLETLALEIDDQFDSGADPVAASIKDQITRKGMVDVRETAGQLLAMLYRIGAVGLKLSKERPFQWSYKSVPVVAPEQISEGIGVAFHPMIQPSLNLNRQLSVSL